MNKKREKLKYIIVLSTERRSDSGLFPDFEQDRGDSSSIIYVGGEVRMRSALEAARRHPHAQFVMVGGYAKENGGLISKPEDMAKFMREHFPDLKLRIINSLPSTRGNLVSLFNELGPNLKPGNFAVLSNDYHIERIAEFWKQLREKEYPDLPDPEFMPVSKLGLKEAADPSSEEFLLRLKREQEGIQALRGGGYEGHERRRVSREDLPLHEISNHMTPGELKRMNGGIKMS